MVKHNSKQFQQKYLKKLTKDGFTCKKKNNCYFIYKGKNEAYLLHLGPKGYHPLRKHLKHYYNYIL